MELLTQTLPSGYKYPFASIHLKPLTFAQILEYLENVPKNPLEKFYFDYCLIKNEDPNIEQLLMIDMKYVIYMKKAVTISENLEFTSSVKCPRCGSDVPYHITLAGIEWNKMDQTALEGFAINFGGEVLSVRMPTVFQFMEIYKKYRYYKRGTDIKIIELVSLFEASEMYLQRIESKVVGAVHKDISKLFMLDKIYYDFVKPMHLHCHECEKMHIPTESEIYDCKVENSLPMEEPLSTEYLDQIKRKHGGIEIGVEPLVSNFFRDVNYNNQIDESEILPRKVR